MHGGGDTALRRLGDIILPDTHSPSLHGHHHLRDLYLNLEALLEKLKHNFICWSTCISPAFSKDLYTFSDIISYMNYFFITTDVTIPTINLKKPYTCHSIKLLLLSIPTNQLKISTNETPRSVHLACMGYSLS